jgi:K+-transporting ATPase ATPase C chain
VGSGGSNLGPTSKKLVDGVRQRVVDYRIENGLGSDAMVPADAVTTSASGLDPHISVKNALLQAKRVAGARSFPVGLVMEKIDAHTESRTLGILGEPRVNVLMLNFDLDGKL